MKTINIIHIIFESAIILGYLIGLIPFVYLALSVFWVLPMVIINFVFSNINKKNKTFEFDLVNMIMAIIALIPLIGYFARIVGIVMAIFSIIKISKNI